MSNFPSLTLATALGPFEVWATSDHHIGMHSLIEDPAMVNRVAYSIRFDIERKTSLDYSDRIVEGAEDWSYHYSSLSMNRKDTYGAPSSAAYGKALKVLLAELVALINSPKGAELLADASLKRTASDLAKIKAEIAELDAKKAELEARLDALNAANVSA